jgi:hypothetical protein
VATNSRCERQPVATHGNDFADSGCAHACGRTVAASVKPSREER